MRSPWSSCLVVIAIMTVLASLLLPAIAKSKGNWFTGREATEVHATAKYDANGNQIWVVNYNSPGNGDDRAEDVAVDAAGNVYVIGLSHFTSGGDFAATIKYAQTSVAGLPAITTPPRSQTVSVGMNATFTVQADGIAPLSYQWQLNGTNLTASTNAVLNLTNITASQAGEYTVVVSNSFGTVTSSAAVLTVYSQVRQSWVARYDSLRNAGPLFATSVSVDSRGSVVIAGEDNWNYATVKYDATGNQLWTARYYGSDRSDGPNALRLDGADNIVVTGQSHSVTGGGGSDAATVKYGPTGNQLWAARYNSGYATHSGSLSVPMRS